MKIIDAIRSATGEDAVYSLLTSYLESFWESDEREGLDEPLRRLPIAGMADVLQRAQLLESQRALSPKRRRFSAQPATGYKPHQRTMPMR